MFDHSGEEKRIILIYSYNDEEKEHTVTFYEDGLYRYSHWPDKIEYRYWRLDPLGTLFYRHALDTDWHIWLTPRGEELERRLDTELSIEKMIST